MSMKAESTTKVWKLRSLVLSADVSGLFALQTVAHFLRLGGVGNHSDRIVVAHVLPEPVEQYHYLVLYAEDGSTRRGRTRR